MRANLTWLILFSNKKNVEKNTFFKLMETNPIENYFY